MRRWWALRPSGSAGTTPARTPPVARARVSARGVRAGTGRAAAVQALRAAGGGSHSRPRTRLLRKRRQVLLLQRQLRHHRLALRVHRDPAAPGRRVHASARRRERPADFRASRRDGASRGWRQLRTTRRTPWTLNPLAGPPGRSNPPQQRGHVRPWVRHPRACALRARPATATARTPGRLRRDKATREMRAAAPAGTRDGVAWQRVAPARRADRRSAARASAPEKPSMAARMPPLP